MLEVVLGKVHILGHYEARRDQRFKGAGVLVRDTERVAKSSSNRILDTERVVGTKYKLKVVCFFAEAGFTIRDYFSMCVGLLSLHGSENEIAVKSARRNP
jgi:hypothetical protein